MKTIICKLKEPHGKQGTETFDWGQIDYLFKSIIIIKSENEEVLGWFLDGVPAEFDELNFLSTIPNDSLFSLQWQHNSSTFKSNKTSDWWTNIGTQNVSEKAICIIDTGVASHSDLNLNRIQLNVNGQLVYALTITSAGMKYHTSLSDTTQYCYPHGTHVAGIASGVGNNGIGIAGAYWRNKIFSINVFEWVQTLFGRQLGAYNSSILSALSIVASLPEIRCVNMSLGGGYSETIYEAFKEAFEELENSEQFVVCAAGNSGLDISTHKTIPACVDTANNNAVGSSDINGNKSWFSNYSTSIVPALIAGGSAIKSRIEGKYSDDDILSTIPNDTTDEVYSIITEGTQKYGYMAGTSMACPFYCGVANILFQQLKTKYPDFSFSALCESLKLCFIGASYNHTFENFEYSTSGGIVDLSLLKPNDLTFPRIVSTIFEDEILKITVKNTDTSSHYIYCSLGAGRFISPLEDSSADKIMSDYVVLSAGNSFTFEFEIDDFYQYSSIAILTCYTDGNLNLYGLYRKSRIYNLIGDVTSPCPDILIRSDIYDYPPLRPKDYDFLNAGFISTLAERVQRRLLFLYNSLKESDLKYHYFVPVSTNGLCFNTINEADNTLPKFPCRTDANANDTMLAIMSMYVQMKEVFDTGIHYGDRIWYVLDYSYYKETGIFRKFELPEEYVFSDGEMTKDKIGQVARALNFMIFKSKILFSVNYNLYFHKESLLSYGERFEPNLNEILSKETFSWSSLHGERGAIPNSYESPPGSGKYRYKLTCSYCTDPYIQKYDDIDTCWVLDWGQSNGLVHYTNNVIDDTIYVVSEGSPFDIMLFQTTLDKPRRWVYFSDSKIIKHDTFYFDKMSLPLALYFEPEEEPQNLNPQYDPSRLVLWESGTVGYGLYIDQLPEAYRNYALFIHTKTQNKNYAISRTPYQGDRTFPLIYAITGRLVTGFRTFMRPLLPYCGESVNIEIPINLSIIKQTNVSSHWDTCYQYPYFNKNESYDYPTGQHVLVDFFVSIKIINKNNEEREVYSEIITVFNYSNPDLKNKLKEVVVNFKQYIGEGGDEYIQIDVIPDFSTIKKMPVFNLIVPATYNENMSFFIPPASNIELLFKEEDGTYRPFASESYESSSFSVDAVAIYTRSASAGINIDPTTPASKSDRYYDVRGLPVDILDDVLFYLGAIRSTFSEEQGYLHLDCCGWEKLNENYTQEFVVVDQIPAQYYPTLFKDGVYNRMYFAVAKIEDKKPEYEMVVGGTLLTSEIETSNLFHSRLNHDFYKLNSDLNPDFNKNGRIAGFMPIIPNIIDFTEDEFEEFFVTHVKENVDYLYHPEGGGKIRYQFPPANCCANTGRVVVGIPFSDDIDDYELMVIPDVTFLKRQEIPDAVLEKFDIFELGTASSFLEKDKIVAQFPPAGVCFIKKTEDKLPFYILTANKNYMSISKIYNITY